MKKSLLALSTILITNAYAINIDVISILNVSRVFDTTTVVLYQDEGQDTGLFFGRSAGGSVASIPVPFAAALLGTEFSNQDNQLTWLGSSTVFGDGARALSNFHFNLFEPVNFTIAEALQNSARLEGFGAISGALLPGEYQFTYEVTESGSNDFALTLNRGASVPDGGSTLLLLGIAALVTTTIHEKLRQPSKIPVQ